MLEQKQGRPVTNRWELNKAKEIDGSDLWHAMMARDGKTSWKLLKYFLKGCYPMLLYILWYFMNYLWVEHIPRLHYTNIHVALDDYIPFCEYFIVPYLLWFAFMIFNVSFLFLYDRENYHKVATMLYLGGTLFVIVSLFWPNIQYLRLNTMPRDNVFTHMVQNLWNTDTPTNLCPSIHVFYTLSAMIGIFHCHKTKFGKSPFYRIPMYILGVLIILSTMFIKQHSVFDVVCAFVSIGVSYVMVYRYNFLLSGENNSLTAYVRAHRSNREKKPSRSYIH